VSSGLRVLSSTFIPEAYNLTLKAEGWENFMNASVNGILKGAISMQIENTDMGEIYATSTSSDGYICNSPGE
jgi:hypothetical protein